MIEQNAKVVSCRGSQLRVRLGAETGCAACAAGHGCGAGLFARLLQSGPVEIEVERGGLEAVPGQMVTLALPEKTYLKLVWIFYAWPLLAALVAALFVDNVMAGITVSSGVVDGMTLAAALLAGGLVARAGKTGEVSSALLGSLRLAACKSAESNDVRREQADGGHLQ